MFQKLIKLLKNQVLIYFLIRYGVYFLQFIISILIAVKLGTYYFGLWSFFLLIMSYFQIFDFGIPNSLSILLVQNKNEEEKTRDIVKTSFYLITILILGVVLIGSYYLFFGESYIGKYKVGNYFYYICILISFGYFNRLLMTIHRVKNKLIEISFFQAIIQILVFISIFLAEGKQLLNLIIGSYLVGNILSFLVFTFSKTIPSKGVFVKTYARSLVKKGWFLFIYNFCFYLLAISVRTVVSVFYSVEEFAFFSFSYTMASAIILLLEATGFVIFPKMIDKLANDNLTEVKKLLSLIKEQYVTIAYGLIYMALIFFPILLDFIPKYKDALMSLNLTALTIVLYINAFGYNTYLIANNFEKLISTVSVLILALNLMFAILISYFFPNNYSFVILSLFVTYMLYTIILTYYGNLKMKTPKSIFMCFLESYPLRILVPHLLAVLISFINKKGDFLLMLLPFSIYIFFNIKNIKSLIFVFLKILKNPKIISI
ncbi:oligosaccharide flippase family protein [Tenacibaculum maritimum]|uniref:lipopolysaccharide biosynthesis protein n=1 Tax=Tenacibaculum maritimum TaxID=107401 RepID=UPI00387618B3